MKYYSFFISLKIIGFLVGSPSLTFRKSSPCLSDQMILQPFFAPKIIPLKVL